MTRIKIEFRQFAEILRALANLVEVVEPGKQSKISVWHTVSDLPHTMCLKELLISQNATTDVIAWSTYEGSPDAPEEGKVEYARINIRLCKYERIGLGGQTDTLVACIEADEDQGCWISNGEMYYFEDFIALLERAKLNEGNGNA